MHLISTLASFVFIPSVFRENIPTAEFGLVSTETVSWDVEKANILMRTFTRRSTVAHVLDRNSQPLNTDQPILNYDC
jgi:hypothetical protein